MMKKLVLSVVILCGFTMSLLAQGIQFREGSWKETWRLPRRKTNWCSWIIIQAGADPVKRW